MVATCTFDSVTVETYRVEKEMVLGTAGGLAYEVTLACRIKTHANYLALAAKAGPLSKTTMLNGKVDVYSPLGSCKTLVLGGVTYTNCYIESISAAEVSKSNLGVWEFTVSFVRHTA